MLLFNNLDSCLSTDTSIRDCLHLALDLVVALAKFLLVLFFSLEETLVRAYSLS